MPFVHTFHCFLGIAEMGARGAIDTAAGPVPCHFSLHSRVKGQDGTLQLKRAQTGKMEKEVIFCCI